MSAWRTIRTHTWVVQHWVILCPQSVNRMLITIQSSLTVPFLALALQSVRHVTSSSMSLLSLKDRGKEPDQGEPRVWKRQGISMKPTRRSKFFFFLQLLFLSFFSPFSEKWQSSFLITVFLSCVLSNGAQLWWPISFRVLQPGGLMGGELSACFHTLLIQNHDWSSTTPRSSYLPQVVNLGIWRTLQLHGVLNGYLMAGFCHLNFTYTHSLKDPDPTLARHYNAFYTSLLCALSIWGTH